MTEQVDESASTLRRIVQHRSFVGHRELDAQLARSEDFLREIIRTVPPTRDSGIVLELSASLPDSISRLALLDPGEDAVTTPVQPHTVGRLDLDALRAQIRTTEIDMAELTGHVAESVDALGAASIADVLARHPATQGVASVIGLQALATAHGSPRDGTERVAWSTTSGRTRTAVVPAFAFTRHVAKDLT